MYIFHKNKTIHFPNQNVYNTRFLINHPQLSVNYHQKQMYEKIIREKYNSIYPSFQVPYTLYDSIYKPTITQSPN